MRFRFLLKVALAWDIVLWRNSGDEAWRKAGKTELLRESVIPVEESKNVVDNWKIKMLIVIFAYILKFNILNF